MKIRLAALSFALLLPTTFLHAQLSGDFSVGRGGDFETLTAAVEALNEKGVDGPTRFIILDGRYEEQVRVANVPGAGDRNPITFESRSRDPKSVTIFYKHLGASANNNEHVIRIDSTDNVTLRNLTLENPGDIYGTGLRVTGSADITLEKCVVRMNPELEFLQPLHSGVFLFHAPNMTVRESVLTGGFSGVNASGLSDSVPTERITVEQSTFSNGVVGSGGVAIQIARYNNPIVRENRIDQTDGNGIGLEDCFGRLRVEANRITLRPERFGIGINARNCRGNGERLLFANNVVTVIDGDTLTAVLGISFSDIIAADFFYNSVHLSNGNTDRFQTTSNTTASFSGFDNDSLRIFNNIFTNLQGREAIAYPFTTAFVEADHNNFYTDGDLLGTAKGVRVPTLDSLQRATGQDLNSFAIPPCYSARDDLRTHSELLDGAGRPFPEVTTDINGNPRDPANPDIGAYEYDYVRTGLSGTYRVGPGGDYETLRQAVEDLHTRCVEGPVDFELLPGEHEGQITLNAIPGTNEQDRITFRSEIGNPQSGTISYRFTFILQQIFRLRNAEHITLRNLRFLPLDTIHSGISLRLVGQPRDIIIEGNRFDNDEARTLPPRVVHIYAEDEGTQPEDVIVRGNRFNGGTAGVRFTTCFGFGCEDSTRVKGTEITGNIFRVTDTARSFRSAITVGHHDGPLIEGNDIETFGTAISLTGISGFLRILNNRIDVRGSNFGGSSATGISHSFPDRMEPFGLIANNMIKAHDPVYIPDRTSQLVGVNIGQAKNTFLFYNTIVVEDSATTALPLSIPFGSDSITAVNNILANYSGGPALQIKFIERFNKDFRLDYNLLHTTGDTLAIWNDTGRVDLAQIQSILGTDLNTVVGEPQFLSDSDLHIQTTSPAVNAGLPVGTLLFGDIDYADMLARDFDDEVRGFDFSEIGADELDILSVDMPSARRGEQRLTLSSDDGLTVKVEYMREVVGETRVVVLDMVGREVMVPVEQSEEAGPMSHLFSVESLPSGLYFVLLTTEMGGDVEQMIIRR